MRRDLPKCTSEKDFSAFGHKQKGLIIQICGISCDQVNGPFTHLCANWPRVGVFVKKASCDPAFIAALCCLGNPFECTKGTNVLMSC